MRYFSKVIVVAALGVVLANCAGTTQAQEPGAPSSATVESGWIEPMSLALADFRQRHPDTWRCYTASVSVDADSLLNVTFGSQPEPRMVGDQVHVTLGDAGRCGPSLTYVFGEDGQIRGVRGIR